MTHLSHDHQLSLHDHASVGIVNGVEVKTRGHQIAMLVPGVPFPFRLEVGAAGLKADAYPPRIGCCRWETRSW